MLCACAPMLCDCAPMLCDCAPMLCDCAPMLCDCAPMLCDCAPMLCDCAPVLCDCAPMLSLDVCRVRLVKRCTLSTKGWWLWWEELKTTRCWQSLALEASLVK